LSSYTVYWYDSREDGDCEGIVLEFQDDKLQAEWGYLHGDVSDGCCIDDTESCLARYEDLVERQFESLESLAAGTERAYVALDSTTGLPTRVVYGYSRMGLDDQRVLILVEPFFPSNPDRPIRGGRGLPQPF
jgi:hypothetical protein